MGPSCKVNIVLAQWNRLGSKALYTASVIMIWNHWAECFSEKPHGSIGLVDNNLIIWQVVLDYMIPVGPIK